MIFFDWNSKEFAENQGMHNHLPVCLVHRSANEIFVTEHFCFKNNNKICLKERNLSCIHAYASTAN